MDGIVSDLRAQHDELTALLEELDDDGWGATSRCPGWSVADVVLHLAQTNEMALGSLTGRFQEVLAGLLDGARPADDVDEGAAVMVDVERGLPRDQLLARWTDGARELCEHFLATDPSARVDWVAGQLSARTLASTRLAETWIHSGDVFETVGREPAATDRLRHIARLAWRTLPYAFQRAGRGAPGPVAFVLTAPSGDTWTFTPDGVAARTTISGSALELCNVAGQRAAASETSLSGEGPDAAAVLELVRTFA